MEDINAYESSDNLDSIEKEDNLSVDASNLNYAEFTGRLIEMVDMQLVKIRSKK